MWYSSGNVLLKLHSSVKILLAGQELFEEVQQVMLRAYTISVKGSDS